MTDARNLVPKPIHTTEVGPDPNALVAILSLGGPGGYQVYELAVRILKRL